MRNRLGDPRRRAATRADVLACVGAVGLLVMLLGLRPASITTDTSPMGLYSLAESSRRATCQSNLRVLSMAEFMSMDDHAGYATFFDDGGRGPISMTLTWADLLYDTGYLPAWEYQICPTPPRPDEPVAQRGVIWGMNFVDEFGAGETPKPGVRTSYGINSVIANSWGEDRFADASRQILIADGQWSWLSNINAKWALQGYVGINRSVLDMPHWQPTAAWRHGPTYQANLAFMDGSVRSVTPRIPGSRREFEHTVDTTEVFTWLPGEDEDRFDTERYRGEISEFSGRTPAMAAGSAHNEFAPLPLAEVSPYHRTNTESWICLPNDPDDRR